MVVEGMGEGTSPRDLRPSKRSVAKIWGGKWGTEKLSQPLKPQCTHPKSWDHSTYFIRVDLRIG